MAHWIVSAAAAGDAQPAVQSAQLPPPDVSELHDRVAKIVGLGELLRALQGPRPVVEALVEDLEQLGAVDVSELAPTDWQALNVWSLLKPLQQRRVLQHLDVLGARALEPL